jgi:hypothetical protein
LIRGKRGTKYLGVGRDDAATLPPHPDPDKGFARAAYTQRIDIKVARPEGCGIGHGVVSDPFAARTARATDA